MADVNHRVSRSSRILGIWNLAAKIAAALALCLGVQVLLAQAPAGSGSSVREEVDPRGFKYQAPSPEYVNPKSKSKLNDIKNRVRTTVTSQPSGIENPVTKTQLDFFYLQVLFPLMTTEEGLKTLSEERRIFLSQHVAGAKDPAMHTYLINTTLSSMTKIVQDTAYLPAARYNAMYIISSLNDQEPNPIGANPTLPEPMRQALPFILQQFQAGSSDEIKIAALLGLSRHLEWENYKQPPSTPMSPANRTAIIKELTTLAEAKEVLADRDPEVQVRPPSHVTATKYVGPHCV